MWLLQYDGDPIGICDGIWVATKGSQVPCLLALALRLQVLASIRIVEDVAPLKDALADPVKRELYEAWEIAHFEIVVDFVAHFDQLPQIALRCVAHMQLYPLDIFTLRILLLSSLLVGSMRLLGEVLPALLPPGVLERRDNLTAPYIMAWAAFAKEEMEMLDEAVAMNDLAILTVQQYGREKLSVGSGAAALKSWAHPFAVHVLCHVYETRRDPVGGLAAVHALDPLLWVTTKHLTVHLYWHLALFSLDSDRVGECLQIYDSHIAPRVSKEDLFSMCDATALLCRLDIRNAGAFGGTVDGIKTEDAAQSRAALAELQRRRSLGELWSFHSGDGPRLARLQDCNFFAFHLAAFWWMSARLEHAGRGGFLVKPEAEGVLFSRSQLVGKVAMLLKQLIQKSDTFDSDLALVDLKNRAGDRWQEIGGSNAQRSLIQQFIDLAICFID
jgi:hypothetical protein